MPEMDGYRVAELIIATEIAWFKSMQESDCAVNRSKSKRFTPIIAITAHSDKSVKEKALKVGMK